MDFNSNFDSYIFYCMLSICISSGASIWVPIRVLENIGLGYLSRCRFNGFWKLVIEHTGSDSTFLYHRIRVKKWPAKRDKTIEYFRYLFESFKIYFHYIKNLNLIKKMSFGRGAICFCKKKPLLKGLGLIYEILMEFLFQFSELHSINNDYSSHFNTPFNYQMICLYFNLSYILYTYMQSQTAHHHLLNIVKIIKSNGLETTRKKKDFLRIHD